jgi:hypothetical protein
MFNSIFKQKNLFYRINLNSFTNQVVKKYEKVKIPIKPKLDVPKQPIQWGEVKIY